MLAVNYSTIRNNLKGYCDKAVDSQEVIIVTRKNEKNVVIMSLDEYNAIQKRINNDAYIAKLEQALKDLQNGRGISVPMEEFGCEK